MINNAFAENGVLEGRKVIKIMEKEIKEFLLLTDYELKNSSPEFRLDYTKKVLPRYKKLAQNISEDAIKWVDIDHDHNPELIFWTSGLALDIEETKEFLFIVEVIKDEKPRFMLIHQLNPEPTKNVEGYEYSRFASYPNRGRGYNNFLCAIFSYATFGVNATNFINYEIFWNKISNKIDISEFYTSFPVAVEKVPEDQSWSTSSSSSSKK